MRSAKLAIVIYICLVICLFIFFIVWYKKDQQVRFLSRPADHILTETYYAKVTIPGLAGSRLQFKKPEPAKYPPNVLVVSPGFFKLFPCHWLAGSIDSLARKGNVVLTERQASGVPNWCGLPLIIWGIGNFTFSIGIISNILIKR